MDYCKQIDAYLKGKLSPEQIESLWSQLIADQELYDSVYNRASFNSAN